MSEQPPILKSRVPLRDPDLPRHTWIRAAILTGLGLIVLPLAGAAAELLPVMPPMRGLVIVQREVWFFGAWALIAYPVAAIAIAALMATQRRWRLPGVMVLFGFALGLVAWMQSGTDALRIRYLMRVPQRAAPMIRAIETYETHNGRYPDRLHSLVPKYLQAIPETGMGGYPRYGYSTNKDGFRVLIPIPFGLKFDFLAYKSSGQYSDYGPPRPIEELLGLRPRSRESQAGPHRVYLMPGDWAFYSE
jgi:hypothetical protein